MPPHRKVEFMVMGKGSPSNWAPGGVLKRAAGRLTDDAAGWLLLPDSEGKRKVWRCAESRQEESRRRDGSERGWKGRREVRRCRERRKRRWDEEDEGGKKGGKREVRYRK